MKKLLDVISEYVALAFRALELDEQYAQVVWSARPDLCEFQCNGSMALAKTAHKAPIMIAEEVASKLSEDRDSMFEEISAVKPGFLNFKLKKSFLASYLSEMQKNPRFGSDPVAAPKKIILDYGGPNVAKPLHVGHLRSAIIGESIKRILRYMGHEVTGDVHLGDWGLQMGLIITELSERKGDLPYFDPDYDGEYPKEPPFTIDELEEIYPTASAKSKEDEAYKERALAATHELQQGRRGYRAILSHILSLSVGDLKKNYEKLKVSFDLWKGESDADPYIADMVEMMKAKGLCYESEGALVVDVAEETDTKEIPPCMILKSDGASLYTTTDLATLVMRMQELSPDEVVYIVDKRQELHFVQVFRCAKKTGIVPESVSLEFIGFGTMNGKDGKPFKTRDGGVMLLSNLIKEIEDRMYERILEADPGTDPKSARETAEIVGLSALKYGDLSNQASKDYVFDIDRFTSSEGNTGPYLLYTIVRIKSILRKYAESGGSAQGTEIADATTESEKNLMLRLSGFNAMIENAAEEKAPHKICAFVYELCNAFNHFYHETKILAEEDQDKQKSYIRLLTLTRDVMLQCIDLLGFEAPEKM
ncbi:MAG: arginine--tRNA ligase [Lachnospiraceae bacterium]|nr:arginine--tRNA ligase [Lachnospiraceae bacterium]